MATVTDPIVDAQILTEVIAPDRPDYSPDLARLILELRFSEEQVSLMRELADKNNRGTISEKERAVMESYRRIGNLLALLQAKARLSLARAEESGSP